MAEQNIFSFSISPNDFDVSLLPPHARTVGSPDFGEEVHNFLKKEFENIGGAARILVHPEKIEVTWTTKGNLEDPLAAIIKKLDKREYQEAIVLLKLLLSREPNDITVLYNLGMVLSDIGQLSEAVIHLRKAVALTPKFVNALVALGVALFRLGKYADAKHVLVTAVDQEPDNPWALRNLGACLLQDDNPREAETYLRKATELSPNDQQAMIGLAQSLLALGDIAGADNAYIQVIAINEHSQIAEMARKARSQIGHVTFKERSVGGIRPDAMMYCLGAIQRFNKMTPDEVQKIGFEIAILGMRGLDVNDSTQKYSLRSLPGSFSGLHLVSLMYVAFRRIAPERDVGFDLSKEYQAALAMVE